MPRSWRFSEGVSVRVYRSALTLISCLLCPLTDSDGWWFSHPDLLKLMALSCFSHRPTQLPSSHSVHSVHDEATNAHKLTGFPFLSFLHTQTGVAAAVLSLLWVLLLGILCMKSNCLSPSITKYTSLSLVRFALLRFCLQAVAVDPLSSEREATCGAAQLIDRSL